MKLSLKHLYLKENKKSSKDTKDKEDDKQAFEPSLSLHSLYHGNFQNYLDEQEKLEEQRELELNEDDQNVTISPTDQKLMNDLETGIENAIEKTVSLEEDYETSDDITTLSEKMSARGFKYENQVIQALMKAKAAGNIKKGAGASSAAADADMNIFGNVFNVEVKLNPNAQMGGSSVRYVQNGEIDLVSKLEEDTEDILINAIKEKQSNIDKLLDFLAEQDPEYINKERAIKFPLTCTKNAWEAAAEQKLLVNARIPFTAQFIANHYAKKGIYYIQIGQAGLFYLKKNPANLPIPKLEGDVVIEIRSARSGSKTLSSGVKVVSGGIRVQGRLKTKNKSPYTLDDPKSIKAMLDQLKSTENKASSSKRSKKRERKRK